MISEESSVSAVILAGGKSSRMGKCKAELPWGDSTLLLHQIAKLRALGIEDIIISGYPLHIDGVRTTADTYPLRGPLSGIHAGLAAARGKHCLVTGVDTPLVAGETYLALINAHLRNLSAVTILKHDDRLEPLMGVYESSLSGICEQILMSSSTAVRELYALVPVSTVTYTGDRALLLDCNSPEDYRAALDILSKKQTLTF